MVVIREYEWLLSGVSHLHRSLVSFMSCSTVLQLPLLEVVGTIWIQRHDVLDPKDANLQMAGEPGVRAKQPRVAGSATRKIKDLRMVDDLLGIITY